MRLLDPPLDPSSGEARRWLADELAKAEYALEENPIRRAIREFLDWFMRQFDGGAGEAVSRWWMVVIIALLLVIVGIIIWAVVRLQPGRRMRRQAEGGIFDEAGISAAEYRTRAESARAAGDFAGAVLDGYRAIAGEAVERFILDDRPGATAREIARDLAAPFPGERPSLRDAAATFDAVRYGDAAVGADDAERILDLDRRLRAIRPELEAVR